MVTVCGLGIQWDDSGFATTNKFRPILRYSPIPILKQEYPGLHSSPLS